jgi:hypothetical protein
MNLSWQLRRNLENSLVDFLNDQADGLTVFYKGANQPIDIRVGKSPQQDWKLPNISVYMDSKTALRGFVGNNKRLKSYLMIIDIRALDDGMRSDLAEWVSIVLNEGFNFYDYQPNQADPNNLIKTLEGKISIEFVTDNPLQIIQDAELFDKHRHNLTVSLTIFNKGE